MALVTITYNAWDHNRQPIPAAQAPEVWFRPLGSSYSAGLMTDREVKGTLNATTGAGSVQLETSPDLLYVPFMRWLVPGQENTPNAARGYAEWPAVFPADGGPIDSLPGAFGRLSGVWYGFGDPPDVVAAEPVVYLDISGPGIGVWVPSGAVLKEGVVI